MARFNLIQIEDIYLTSDGTSGGSRCKNEIPDLIRLRTAKRRTLVDLIEGPSQVQLFDNLIGESFTIRVQYIKKSVLDDVIEIIDLADSNHEFITVKITGGDIGEFDLECQFEAITGGSQFSNGIVKSVDISFKTAGMNEEE